MLTLTAMYSVSSLLGFPATTPGSPRSEIGRGQGFGPPTGGCFAPPEPRFLPLADAPRSFSAPSGRLATASRPCEPTMLINCSPISLSGFPQRPWLRFGIKFHRGALRRHTSRMAWSALGFRFRGRRTWPQARQSADPRVRRAGVLKKKGSKRTVYSKNSPLKYYRGRGAGGTKQVP